MGRSTRALIGRAAAAIAIAALFSACTTLPGSRPTPTGAAPADRTAAPPAATTTPSSSAVAGLLAQSRAARTEGDNVAAGAALERALRLAPNSALLWLEYAELRLAEGDYRQAETLARKAASLAGEDRATRDAALRLIEAAKSAG